MNKIKLFTFAFLVLLGQLAVAQDSFIAIGMGASFSPEGHLTQQRGAIYGTFGQMIFQRHACMMATIEGLNDMEVVTEGVSKNITFTTIKASMGYALLPKKLIGKNAIYIGGPMCGINAGMAYTKGTLAFLTGGWIATNFMINVGKTNALAITPKAEFNCIPAHRIIIGTTVTGGLTFFF